MVAMTSTERSARYRARHPERVREYARRWEEENREHLKQMRARRRANPAVMEKERESCRRYYARNREKMVERARRYHREHTEKARAASRQVYWKNVVYRRAQSAAYKRAHPERNREWAARRRARMRGNLPVDYHEQLLGFQGGRCPYCHEVLEETHLDHVIPLSRGGVHSWENVVLACPGCNTRKSARTPEEWCVT